MKPEELKTILDLHRKWLNGEAGGLCASLARANLAGANLTGANLTGASLPPFRITPEAGQFTAYKKVQGGAILTLLIPSDAKRTNMIGGRKCRASKAIVVSASTAETEFRSNHDSNFVYRVGDVVEVPDFDDDIRVECTRGIHFFISRAEAEAY